MALKDSIDLIVSAGEEMTTAWDFLLSAPELTADGLELTSDCERTREEARSRLQALRASMATLRYQLVRAQVRLNDLEKEGTAQ